MRLSSSTLLRGGSGLYRQPPALSLLNGLRANPGLADERAIHADLSLVQSLPSSVVVQVSWFARDEHDVLRAADAEPRRLADGSFVLGRGDARWDNRLRGRARGVEAMVRRDAPNGVSGWIGYAFARHRYTDAARGEEFWSDYDQRHSFSAYVTARVSNRTSIGAKVRYGSNYPVAGYIREDTNSTMSQPLFNGMRPLFFTLAEQRNTLRLPEYLRVDLRADRATTVAGRRVTVFVEVVNALNRRNERNVPYEVRRDGRVSGVTDSLLPIVPPAGFVVEF